MTPREKQIDEFAYSQVDCEFFDERLHEGIIIGAKWADEHPNPEMVNKQEFIEKAKAWVKNRDNAEKYLHYRSSFIDDFADALCKYLEE